MIARLPALLATTLLLSAPAAFAGHGEGGEIMKLHEEIAALKLDHALNLTRDQARTLLPMLKERQAAQEQKRLAHEQAKPAMIATLTKARDELKATGTVSDGTQKALDAAHGQAFAQMREDGQRFHQQVKALLTPQQIDAVKALRFGPGPGAFEHAGMGPAGGFGGGEEGAHPMQKMMKGMVLHHMATSPAFIALVEARAR
jgi:hypothetical protein